MLCGRGQQQFVNGASCGSALGCRALPSACWLRNEPPWACARMQPRSSVHSRSGPSLAHNRKSTACTPWARNAPPRAPACCPQARCNGVSEIQEVSQAWDYQDTSASGKFNMLMWYNATGRFGDQGGAPPQIVRVNQVSGPGMHARDRAVGRGGERGVPGQPGWFGLVTEVVSF